MKLSRFLPVAVFVLCAIPSKAAFLSEEFDDITTLGGSGWVLTNNSSAGGVSWFQGNTGVFTAQDGATDQYIASNFGNGLGNNISLWLLSPVVSVDSSTFLSFWARTEPDAFPGDNLEVWFSPNGASTNVGGTDTSLGDFTTLLTSISSATFPQDWTQYTVNFSGVATGRIGFRYVVTDTAANGDYIGIDTVLVSSTAVPEPSTALMMGAGIALLAVKRAKRSRIA